MPANLPWCLTHPYPALAASGRYPQSGHGASQPRLLRLLSPSTAHLPSGVSCSALRRPVLPTRMASADFYCPIPMPLSIGSTRQDSSSPRGKTRDLHAIYLAHLRPQLPGDIGLRAPMLPRPVADASYALPVRQAGTLRTASSGPRLAATPLLFG